MYIDVIIKTVLLYFFIIIVYRVMGKKEFGQLSIIDFIVSILIVQLTANVIDSKEKSVLLAIVPIVVLVIVQMLISYFSLKNKKLRDFIEGEPVVVIKNGQINFSLMSKMRYNIDDLVVQLREQGISNIEGVKHAILENNGKLSIIDNVDYPLPLIMDGRIDYEVLKEIHKNINWLNKLLTDKGVKLEDVFYAFYTNNKIFIITKTELL